MSLENIKVKYNSRVFKFPFGLFINGTAIVLYPTMHFKYNKRQVHWTLFRHELEHVYQVQKIGKRKFYTDYLLQYFKNLFKYFSFRKAYLNISYEIEAREKQNTPFTEEEAKFRGKS